ncbi:MAG TPA: tetraprenyl-beta-curcumene synthase family protein [Gelria sp.]|nr:tetraprenyl-beta-curcumene synthase family protein [Gelria sp.]
MLEIADTMPTALPVRYRTRSGILSHYIFKTLPQVKKLLQHWEIQAHQCKDPELRKQALASLHTKAFHCHGGAVYAVNCGPKEYITLRLIVAYQTICDYLDNLCDRVGSTDGTAFEQLHRSLFDALTPDSSITDYYLYYPHKDDSGYLLQLVNECRHCVQQLPSYAEVYPDIIKLARWYTDLQVKKHLHWDQREQVLQAWCYEHLNSYPGIWWQEFAAASGSTLAIFALFILATHKSGSARAKNRIIQAYFPWICGLHILLDYFIDQEEDRQGGDLNFTFYYRDELQTIKRLSLFVKNSLLAAASTPLPVFDKTIVHGLLAMYLSDRKVDKYGLRPQAEHLMDQAGTGAKRVYRICYLVRKVYLG